MCALALSLTSPVLAQHLDVAVREASRLRDSGRINDAIRFLQTSLTRNPGNESLSLLLAETLGWQKRFGEAEAIYRDVLRNSGSPSARKGLAQVLLWTGDYRESRAHALAFLKTAPREVETQEIAATAAYWSGDFRSAEREFSEIVRLYPERTESRKNLLEIRSAARPQLKLVGGLTSDSQPYRISRTSAEGSFFSDPLTRWDATIGSYTMDRVRGRADRVAPFAGVGAEVTFPALSLIVRPHLGLLRLPNGRTRPIGSLSGTLLTSTKSRLKLEGQRRELLGGREGSDDHETVDSLGVAFNLEPRAHWLAELRAEALKYSDGNRGESVSGFFLAPVAEFRSTRLSAGCSASWRDTDQTRFRIDQIRAIPTQNFFSYHYDGVYDPYHTPQSLKEARLLMSLEITRGLITGRIRGDLGIARDRGTAFGPPVGPGRDPNIPTYALSFEREFHPWRLALEVSRPIARQLELHASYERSLTSDYRAHTAYATLVRRF